MSQEVQANAKKKNINESEVMLPELSIKTCPNCGEALTGTYCASCGQKDFNMLRPFWTLLEDSLGDLFAFDSRFFGTLIPLFFKPGYLTKEFNRGRRARFVPPFRQYLVISVIFFLLLVSIDFQMFNVNDIKINNSDTGIKSGSIISFNNTDIPSPQKTADQIARPQPADKDKLVDEILDNVVGQMSKKRQENLEKATEAEKQVYDGGLGALGGIKKVWKNPKLLNEVFADWVPKMMFLMLPLFALILKIFYIRRKKYYIEHLVFSLHFHAFLFLLFTIMLLIYHFVPLSQGYLSLLFWYAPIYLLVALYVVYRQSLTKTFFKGLFISLTYFSFMVIGLIVVIGYGLTKI